MPATITTIAPAAEQHVADRVDVRPRHPLGRAPAVDEPGEVRVSGRRRCCWWTPLDTATPASSSALGSAGMWPPFASDRGQVREHPGDRQQAEPAHAGG